MTKSVDMTPDTKPALTPKLRFPEFRGNKSWNTTILGSLAEVVRGGSPRPIDDFLTTASDGLNWLKIGDVDKEAKFVTQTAEKVRAEALSKTRIVNPGDLILSNSMSFGRPYILQITTCIHDGWIAITEITKWAERDFLYYSISAPTSQTYFTNNAAGSGVQNLNADIIKSLKIAFPSNAEQQKIAECLGSLDELIATEIRKLDALKAHKKGLMQQLFPRPGESTPRLRFPEFQDAPEWEIKTMGTVYSFLSNNSLSREKLNYESGTVKNIHYGDIHTKFSTLFDITQESVPYINTSEPEENLQSDSYCAVGDMIFADASEDLEDIGKSIEITRLNSEKLVAGQHTILARKKKNHLVVGFAGHLFKSQQVRAQIQKESQGTKVLGISAKRLDKITLCFPPTGKEQHRIADCLTSLDSQIAAQTTRLATLRTHKQGLMQQLFPPSN